MQVTVIMSLTQEIKKPKKVEKVKKLVIEPDNEDEKAVTKIADLVPGHKPPHAKARHVRHKRCSP